MIKGRKQNGERRPRDREEKLEKEKRKKGGRIKKKRKKRNKYSNKFVLKEK